MIYKPLPVAVLGDYSISEYGDVRNNATGRMLRPQQVGGEGNRKKHLVVRLTEQSTKYRKLYTIAGLVAGAFIGPRPEGLFVCHNDDNKENNHYSNLRYATCKENAHDAVRNGIGQVKISPEECANIKLRREAGERGSDLAREYKVSPQTICDIVKGRRVVV